MISSNFEVPDLPPSLTNHLEPPVVSYYGNEVIARKYLEQLLSLHTQV